jgi:DNA-binding LacI/PurR family transcriptional regulator
VRTARELGYSLLVSETSVDHLPKAMESAASRLVDGIILYAPNLHIPDDELLEISQEIPLVRRDYVPDSKIAWVGFDQVRAAQLAIEYLIELGHTRIAEISPPRHYHNGYWRHRTYIETLRQHDLTPGPMAEGDYSMQSGYDGALALLDSGKPFSSVIVGTDKMALGALHAFREHGLRVPDDISVIGFDNSELAAFVAPPLTTVEFKFEKQDDLAVKYLVELIHDPDIELHQRILLPQLVVRHSCIPRS